MDNVLCPAFFLFYLINFVFCQEPSISFISKERIVSIGDPLELVCQVQYAEGYPVQWVKINSGTRNVFISRGATRIVPDDRYDVYYDDKSTAYKVRIQKTQEVDAGTYQCQLIEGVLAREQANVTVTVRIPPVISDNSTRSVITTVGDTVELHCYASGYPNPIISWRREKSELLPNDRGATYRNQNVLRIFNVTKDDRGTYYCVADNGVVPGTRRAISVEVEFPPHIRVGRKRYGQALQYDMDLQCDIEAFPSSSIHWYKDEEKLTDNQHFQVSIYAKSDEFLGTILRVRRIENKQYGTYYCEAVNKLGTRRMPIALYETVNVICPPACDVYGPLSGSSFLTVTTGLWLLICIPLLF